MYVQDECTMTTFLKIVRLKNKHCCSSFEKHLRQQEDRAGPNIYNGVRTLKKDSSFVCAVGTDTLRKTYVAHMIINTENP